VLGSVGSELRNLLKRTQTPMRSLN